MKNKAPIKRHPAIVSFSKDHHFGLLLVWKIRQGLNNDVNPERISNYIRHFFMEDLEKHSKEEEQLLFSKLPINDVLRKQAEGDHRAIYKLVAAIEKRKTMQLCSINWQVNWKNISVLKNGSCSITCKTILRQMI